MARATASEIGREDVQFGPVVSTQVLERALFVQLTRVEPLDHCDPGAWKTPKQPTADVAARELDKWLRRGPKITQVVFPIQDQMCREDAAAGHPGDNLDIGQNSGRRQQPDDTEVKQGRATPPPDRHKASAGTDSVGGRVAEPSIGITG